MLCPSKIWRRDLNPQPSEHEPPPITTRPGSRIILSRQCDQIGRGLKGSWIQTIKQK